MAGSDSKPLFDGTQATTTTVYYHAPIHNSSIGIYFAWTDATSAATVTLELTSMGPTDAPYTTAGTYQWKDSGLTFTGPAASAAGSLLINVENVRQKRARIKVVTTANSAFKIYDGEGPRP